MQNQSIRKHCIVSWLSFVTAYRSPTDRLALTGSSPTTDEGDYITSGLRPLFDFRYFSYRGVLFLCYLPCFCIKYAFCIFVMMWRFREVRHQIRHSHVEIKLGLKNRRYQRKTGFEFSLKESQRRVVTSVQKLDKHTPRMIELRKSNQ